MEPQYWMVPHEVDTSKWVSAFHFLSSISSWELSIFFSSKIGGTWLESMGPKNWWGCNPWPPDLMHDHRTAVLCLCVSFYTMVACKKKPVLWKSIRILKFCLDLFLNLSTGIFTLNLEEVQFITKILKNKDFPLLKDAHIKLRGREKC